MSYSKILVAYDHSEQSKKAMQVALEFAKEDPALKIQVLTVIYVPTPINYGYSILNYEQINQQYYDQVRENQKELMDQLPPLENEIEFHTEEGSPASTILAFAKENRNDLIIMGNRGLGTLGEFVLGSVSHNVTQHAPVSVMIVK